MAASRHFNGRIVELPGIRCDQFSGRNAEADQFFLSHCHSDHMVGLEELLCRRLRDQLTVNHRLYCSPISKAFLVNRFGLQNDRVVHQIAPNDQIQVHVFDRSTSQMYQLKVTAVPAHHCPGSVMFLFERLDGPDACRILYTGDFRFDDTALTTLTALHQPNGQPVPIDTVYLDTTFCSKAYPSFQTRAEALEQIWGMVSEWIKMNGKHKHKKHVVLIQLPAQYGSESIFVDIFNRSGWKVHVTEQRHQDYLHFAELKHCTTANADQAQWIHACTSHGDQHLSCLRQGAVEIRCIKPCALYFSVERDRTRPQYTKERGGQGDNFHRVCFSCHSSLNELLDFVRYFKPGKIVPCDLPPDMTPEQVLELLSVPGVQCSPKTSPIIGHSRLAMSMDDSVRDSPSPVDIFMEAVSPDTRKRGYVDAGDDKADHGPDPLSVEPLPSDWKDEQCVANRRQLFRRSRTTSRPSDSHLQVTTEASGQPESGEPTSRKKRRASLPLISKVPSILITPSSPSQDPNDPDYPEYYQHQLYLQSGHSKCKSLDS